MIRSKLAQTVSLALVLGLTGISTAHAATGNSRPPAAPSGPKSCEIKMQNDDGSSYNVYYDHGAKVTLKGSDGNKITKKCNDGRWESVKLTVSGSGQRMSTGPTHARR